MTERFDTAHERWDRSWQDAEQRNRWSRPEPVVVDLMPRLRERGVSRILDVGTGIGRHALAYARAGFTVIATDASQAGLDEVAKTADAAGLDVAVHRAPFTALPVETGGVDHVLAWNVLYHGDRDVVRAAFAECRRVLRPGGWFQLTMLSKRNSAYGVGQEVRPDTYVDAAGIGDKQHPHFYADASGVTGLLAEAGFAAISLVDVDQQPPGGYHWVVLAETAG